MPTDVLSTDVYYLSEYNWERGSLARVAKGNKTMVINTIDGSGNLRALRIPRVKCAYPGERVCIVWEMWKGRNGRGGYRVERKEFPAYYRPAEEIARQGSGPGRVSESKPGILAPWLPQGGK